MTAEEREIEDTPFGTLRATVRYRKNEFAGNTVGQKRRSAMLHLKSIAEQEFAGQPVNGILIDHTYYSDDEIEKMICEEIN
jgi:hypothetical protein